MNIAVIGIGLIGGSIAKSVKIRTGHNVFASDLNKETIFFAKFNGAIDDELTKENLNECEMIFLALRPNASVNWIKEHADIISKSSIVIDVCGTKRSVVSQIAPIAQEYGFHYLGGHPMAGKEKGGFVSSSADLFVGASMILTPDETANEEILEELHNFFLDIGFANITITSPEEHDRIIAYTSQLAHIASSAYIKSPSALQRRGFSAGSFKDMTRVAYMDEKMWTELFLDNSDYVTKELEIYIENLKEYLDVIKSKDAKKLEHLLKDGKERKVASGGN